MADPKPKTPAREAPVDRRPVPGELDDWIVIRLDLLAASIRKARVTERDHGDVRQWTMKLLDELSSIEQVAKRAVHLLTIYATRDQLATPSEIAEAANTSIATSVNRAGSKLAQEVWRELYPGSK